MKVGGEEVLFASLQSVVTIAGGAAGINARHICVIDEKGTAVIGIDGKLSASRGRRHKVAGNSDRVAFTHVGWYVCVGRAPSIR